MLRKCLTIVQYTVDTSEINTEQLVGRTGYRYILNSCDTAHMTIHFDDQLGGLQNHDDNKPLSMSARISR